jgi:hypothetical protein
VSCGEIAAVRMCRNYDEPPGVLPRLRSIHHAKRIHLCLRHEGFCFGSLKAIRMLSSIAQGSPTAIGFLIACLALVLAFEFSNGFHDTANAVATVIYTNSLKPIYAVVWSGLMNFLGVIIGGIAVAYALVQLIPPEVLSPQMALRRSACSPPFLLQRSSGTSACGGLAFRTRVPTL